ncbi:DUF397 domain-containing protein [Actinomadura rugatobispora]|uniref:DUF397 domain-containing protein n=1 Tax=Actinomadura rugatobispora TaxID=1994 RepID=A0ABW1ABL0_9ACTN|nr:DUF397 domain-containing protein [Actinomadura rugatobispora]
MTQWRKASYSGTTGGGDCVELAALAEGVGMRDSKDPQDGRHVAIELKSFADLVARIKTGQLDL